MTKRQTENSISKNNKYFSEENQIARKTQLPDFEKFKKMNMLTLHPPIKIETNSEESENKYLTSKSNKISNKISNKKANQANQANTKYPLVSEKEAEQERIKKALFEIANEHIYMFQKITKKVVESKYKKIFEDIYHFIIKLDFYRDSFLQTLLINTDQNADMFFDIMEKHFQGKSGKQKKQNLNNHYDKKNEEELNNPALNNLKNRDYNFLILKESNFYDLKNLFIDLQLYEDKELKEDAEMDIVPEPFANNANNNEESAKNKPYAYEEFKPLPANIIIIREIHLINPVNFNIFLTKLIDFNQVKNKKFSNVILFDVSYDPKGLFEKIKPNILTKIIFNNLDYISSKTIYKEILYNFVHGKKKISEDESEFSFFIPNSNKTKKIIDYVTTHQISIPSFEYYFKFLILEFFLFKKWQNMHFLIYHNNLYSKLKKLHFKAKNKIEFQRDEYLPLIGSFFRDNLKQIRKTDQIDETEIKELVEIYLKTKNTREVFLTIYEFFENINEKLGVFDNEKNNKYDFIFEFLQFGEKLEQVSKNRTDLIIKSIAEKSYIYNIIKNLLIPEFGKIANSFEETSEQRQTILETKEKIKSILKETPVKLSDDLKLTFSRRLMEKSNLSSKQNNNANILKLLETGNQNNASYENHTDNANNENKYSDNNALLASEANKNTGNYYNNNNDDNEICCLNDQTLLIKLKVKLEEFFNNKIFMDFDNVTNLQNSEFESAFIDFENIEETDVAQITAKGESKINKYFYNSTLNDFLNFNEITNPSMQSLFVEDMLGMQFITFDDKNVNANKNNKTKMPEGTYYDGSYLVRRQNKHDMEIDPENFWSNISYSKLFKHFIIVFGGLGLEFRLKFFFSDFLLRFKCYFEETKKVDSLRNVFFKFCHEFYLLGLISRKRPNSDIFVKNFFRMTNYFLKK